MSKGKNVLTTGEVARICNVAPRTVSKWFDSGQLRGYRIPGSKDRRIPVNELTRFMKSHDIPAALMPVNEIRVLIIDTAGRAAASLKNALSGKADYRLQFAASSFDSGAAIQKFSPHVVLINLLAEKIDVVGICESIRADEDFRSIKIIAVSEKLNDYEAAALVQKGFDDYISNPADAGEVIEKIEHATAIIY